MVAQGDFTADRRMVALSLAGAAIGALCAFVAAGLLKLIALFTGLFYYGKPVMDRLGPAAHRLGGWAILVPAMGGMVVGLMARFGSEKIRGHGIPEAMEAILIGRSRLDARVAALKPLSSAIAIGSGGPFGAEGPIIMTGGAFGSLIAQQFHLTSAERKTLLVAGAAGGMSATFVAPMASILLAVELLLFEWKPRSLVPVAMSCAAAALVRVPVLGPGPIFPVSPGTAVHGPGPFECLLLGLGAGVLSQVLTGALYRVEDLFHRLPLHWMWWPALGGLVVGLGGLVEPRALGVGYDVIRDLIAGRYTVEFLAIFILVKSAIWSIALGSGTSGGVLAPLLLVGGCAGALAGVLFSTAHSFLWPLVGMAATLGATMRCPVTAVLFAFELTGSGEALLPCLIACSVAYAWAVLTMKRSILTEKVARRGYHLSHEYAVDPLETVRVDEVMTRDVQTVAQDLGLSDVMARFRETPASHQGYPVVDAGMRVIGILTRARVDAQSALPADGDLTAGDLVEHPAVTIHPDESCRRAAEVMTESGFGRLPVVAREDSRLTGILSRSDLLKARRRNMDQERVREANRLRPYPGFPFRGPGRVPKDPHH